MPKFVVLQGLPASGKSTKAKELIRDHPEDWVRINNDDLRNMFWMQGFHSYNEKLVVECRNLILTEALFTEKNIIIDNVNLNPKRLEEYRETAKMYSYEYEEILIDTDMELCIVRDSLRARPVGEKVIRRFNKSLEIIKNAKTHKA